MNAVWMIASGTFGEAMRRRILQVFLFVALALIVMGFAFSSFSPRQEMVVIKSLGLGSIALAGVFISVILGINLIPSEIERRTIYTILSKPVQRYQFVCGKFLGGLMTVLSNIALMGIVFVGLTFYKEHNWDQDVVDVAKGVLMIFFQLTLVGAVALFFSVFVSPFVNFFLTFAVYLLGSINILGDLASDPSHQKNPISVAFFKVLHFIVPNFDNFNIQNPIIHPDVTITNETLYIWQNILYALVYTAILLTLAVLIFDRREV
jgi:ABC-type transport system involved in multi-copper enzyme maturation permease subunit